MGENHGTEENRAIQIGQAIQGYSDEVFHRTTAETDFVEIV
jgi:hypothetical protein